MARGARPRPRSARGYRRGRRARPQSGRAPSGERRHHDACRNPHEPRRGVAGGRGPCRGRRSALGGDRPPRRERQRAAGTGLPRDARDDRDADAVTTLGDAEAITKEYADAGGVPTYYEAEGTGRAASHAARRVLCDRHLHAATEGIGSAASRLPAGAPRARANTDVEGRSATKVMARETRSRSWTRSASTWRTSSAGRALGRDRRQ